MIEFANRFLLRWAIITVSAFLAIILLLAPILHAHNGMLKSEVKVPYSNQGIQSTFGGTNEASDPLSHMTAAIRQAVNTTKLQTLNSVVETTANITHFEENIAQDTHSTTVLAFQSLGICASLTAHTIVDSFSFPLHTINNVFGFLAGLKDVSALIRPPDSTPTPTITQMRAQEASIIQSGTLDVVAPAVNTGTGGACDNGEGNGGYPMSWCNAPMDSISTLLFNNDPINRECTSYAYWYFTSVEGHTNFEAWGNAKYWATSSNYPTNTTPAIGAIAVETAGAYGHVAIVQGLPGQTYAGEVIPTGYVLVSEMNYDWDGHFRYSYSPLSKFTTYIYS